MKDFLTTGEAAKVTAAHPRTIAKLFDAGTIKGFRMHNDRRIHVGQFREYLATLTNDSGTLKTLENRLDRVLAS